MFNSRRFAAVPAKESRSRLEAALSNARPIAQGEPNRGAVSAIQVALIELNRGYLSSDADGYFGSRTFTAVEAFQRDYGLVADGMVARQTLAQLDTLYSGDVVRKPKGMSIHVGLNRLDAGHYGADFVLDSCINDAKKMQELAKSLGYDALCLFDEQATVLNFVTFMRSAIANLDAGDSLLITFSGHGSQVPNASSDDEDDGLDETLCFYDRMMIDDEVYVQLSRLKRGVRVHAVFDSCHSGTVAKRMDAPQADVLRSAYVNQVARLLKSAPEKLEDGERSITATSIELALDGDQPIFAATAFRKEIEDEVSELFADLRMQHTATFAKAKKIDRADFQAIYDKNKALYSAIQGVMPVAPTEELSCTVVTLSACLDEQTTQAGQVYSLFTYNLTKTWASSAFEGSYEQFHKELVTIAEADATPQLKTYGPMLAKARTFDRPFVF